MSSPVRQRLAVSALIFRGDRVLLLKRAAHETFLPGYYDLPGGKVDLGESPEDAVRREGYEEAGIRLTPRGIYNDWGWTSVYKGELTQFVSISYAAEIAADAEIRLHRDFDQYVWASRDQIKTLPLTPELRHDLEKGFAWQRARAAGFDEVDLLRRALDDRIERLAVGLVVRNPAGQILILRRAAADFMGGLWELPSGKVDPSERLACAAARELREETSLELKHLHACEGEFDYRSKSGRLTRQFNFLAETWPGACRLNAHEHDQHAWVSPADLDRYNVSAEIKTLLRMLK